jgi:putative hydrolase of HD superfamily
MHDQALGQMSGPMQDQAVGQLSVQMHDQVAGQMSGQMPVQMHDQAVGQMSGQLPVQMQDQTVDQTPGQLHDQALGQTPGQMPDNIPNDASIVQDHQTLDFDCAFGPKIANFLFEAASLKRTPRTGYQFLGRGHENVAEHSFGAVVMAYALAKIVGKVDPLKLLIMTLFHDLGEARCGDLNYVNKRYVTAHEEEAFSDAIKDLPFQEELSSIRQEWCLGQSLEAQLGADADQLDMMLELKRLATHGWAQAEEWLFYAQKRLKTEAGRLLARSLLKADPDGWWFHKRDELWVNPTRKEDCD